MTQPEPVPDSMESLQLSFDSYRRELETVLARMEAFAGELRDLRTQYALLRARVDAFAGLAERLASVEAQLGNQGQGPDQGVEGIRAEQLSLAARVEAQEREVQALSGSLWDRGRLLEKLLGCFPNLDMRKARRLSFSEEVTVALLTEPGGVAAGQVINVSDKGLGLVLEAEMPVGAGVEVDINDVKVRGRIVHCRRAADRFSVGVSLDQPLDHSLK